MFTGLIEQVARLKRVTYKELSLETTAYISGLKKGDSIAIDGVCLTLTVQRGRELSFDVSETTIEKSHWNEKLKKGATFVNMERALCLGDRLDGHIVSGHIDGKTHCTSIKETTSGIIITFTIPPNLNSMIALRGSVALDGISLTVSHKEKDSFSVTVIPHTYKNTTLKNLKKETPVHIECDPLARYAVEYLKSLPKGE